MKPRPSVLFRQPHDVLVRDFPAKISPLAALFEALLQEDGASSIANESAGGRQKKIARAILNFNLKAEEG